MNPKTGRKERVFVSLASVYPSSDPSAEYCFEELRARHRGWFDIDWAAERRKEEAEAREKALAVDAAAKEVLIAKSEKPKPKTESKIKILRDTDVVALNDENSPPSQEELEKAALRKKQRREERANRTRKIRVMEVREETQTGLLKSPMNFGDITDKYL